MDLKKKASGVTLIELLIVLVIMMTLVTVIGSLGLKTLTKAKAQTEFISVCNLIKRASISAFARGGNVKVIFSGTRSTVFLDDKLSNQNIFSHLYFEPQTLLFNRNGVANSPQMTVNIAGVQRVVDLAPMLAHSAISQIVTKNEREI